MKTKLLVSIGLVGLMTTGLYAACSQQGNMQKGMMQNSPQGMMKNAPQSKKMMMKKHSKKSQHGMMSMLKKLNLSSEQTVQIMDIKKDMMKDRVTPDVAFTKGGFDKAKFIEIMKQKRDNMIESKAEMIARVYTILTPKQKEQLKVLMELKKEKRVAMMDKRMMFDKNSNGRR